MLALLIDGLNLIRRIDAAIAAVETGQARTATLGRSVEQALGRVLGTFEPTHAALVLDGHGTSWRHQLFGEYKKRRIEMSPQLVGDIKQIRQQAVDRGLPVVRVEAFEADDVIATMATTLANAGGRAVIVSTDWSFCQLLSDSVQVYDHFAGIERDAEQVRSRYGVSPSQLTSVLALAGVSSLSIPGVRGIGLKTAATLVAQYGDLTGVIENAERIPGRPGVLLGTQIDAVRLSHRLVSLAADVEVGVNLKDLRIAGAR